MPIDVRKLFGTMGVEWRDHGSNTSRGNVTIRCPWCGDSDYSGHLKVSETKEAYLCMRNARHAGYHLVRLLMALGMQRDDALELRRNCLTARPEQPSAPELEQGQYRKQISDQWYRFQSAVDSRRCLNYLRKRGFDDPLSVAGNHDLRFAQRGPWASRLLLPLPEQYEVESWVGRAMVSDLDPKYRMEQENSEGLIYLPRGPRSIMEIVEGPMDALKLAVATQDDDHFCAALLGKQLTAAKRLRLMALCRDVKLVVVALDNDSSAADNTLVAYTLQQTLPHCEIIHRRGAALIYKDAGETPMRELRLWARELGA